jgi:hypothetical protein
VFNPCEKVKSFHVHETEMRNYHKKLDLRIIGGVAYVHPVAEYNLPVELEFDVWVRSSKNIKGVKINKSLEKWFAAEEAEQSAKINTTEKEIEFLPCAAATLVKALKQGESIKRQGPNFELFQLDGDYIFKNAFTLRNSKKTQLSAGQKFNFEQLFAFGIIPPVLNDFVDEINLKPKDGEDLNFWQYPCATEKQAYENHLNIKHGDHIDFKAGIVNLYVPLPWATYIDRKGFPQSYLQRVAAIIRQYKTITNEAKLQLRVHSVCQHIHWVRILEKATELGITDLHFSHKDSKSSSKQADLGFDLALHGWPLIAVNYVTPERNEGMVRKPVEDKKLLASFIGAHMPHYLDDSRVQLFEAAKASRRDDVFVDLGNEWHFNKLVYEEQVLSKEIESHHIDEHHQKTFRYNTILSDSVFSLCPLGAGPNTLRLWESIAVGTIPVLFSKDLSILTESELGKQIIDNVVVWDGDVGEHLFEFLHNLKREDLVEKSVSLVSTYQQFETKTCFEPNVKSLNQTVEKTEKKTVKSELKPLNILYVGASVTAQKNGYRPELNRLFENEGYPVTETVLATGATGSLFGLCNLSVMIGEKFELGFYEYSTGDLNVGLTPIDMIYDAVKKSMGILSNACERVFLVHNYRSDFEGEKGDFIRNLYNKAAEELNVPTVNVYKHVEAFKLGYRGNWQDIYRDNVHTANLGSEIVANEIYKTVKSHATPFKFPEVDYELSMLPKIYSLDLTGLDGGTYVYPSSGQKFNYITLEQGTQISFKLKGNILGVIPVVGPTAGWIELSCEGASILKYCLFDKHCHYTRVQPRFASFETDVYKSFKLKILDDGVDLSKCAKPHIGHDKPRELMFSGFMGINLDIKDLKVEAISAD